MKRVSARYQGAPRHPCAPPKEIPLLTVFDEGQPSLSVKVDGKWKTAKARRMPCGVHEPEPGQRWCLLCARVRLWAMGLPRREMPMRNAKPNPSWAHAKAVRPRVFVPFPKASGQ